MPVNCPHTGIACHAEICNAGGWPCEKVDLGAIAPIKAPEEPEPVFKVPTDD